ncbi:replicative DNA helicase [Flexibacter flexilis DSM 6793]|uniref:Replicative DNA helicase n=1 Tax=Flexibacter flexilis DSM 6793 TaxID=927664 RepID=A0A1I1M7V1_9BACT|nr:replicative DNA helicase [Flexibacter flexilis]SFC81471.1 replicative DNA helicase [Flexibacter flexilis DSM 6793]
MAKKNEPAPRYPEAQDLEAAVIGALLVESDAWLVVADFLNDDCFHDKRNRAIFAAIFALAVDRQKIDILTVSEKLKALGLFNEAGGLSYILACTSNVHSAANIEAHARILAEKSLRRNMIRVADSMKDAAFDETEDVFVQLDRAEKQLFEVLNGFLAKKVQTMVTLSNLFIEDLKSKSQIPDGLTGVPSGLTSLDRITSGWQNTDLIVLAARPGMGKTAMIVTMAINAAKMGKKIALFSLEMSALQLVSRIYANELELDSACFRKGELTEPEWAKVYREAGRISELPIYIDDSAGLTVLQIAAKARRIKETYGLHEIIIDYMQLVSVPESKGRQSNREQDIGSISRGLKMLAKDLDVPVIALSQLSRAVESRTEKRPMLSDLRESGSIEQDADMVVFLYRPEYYGITVDENGTSTIGTAEVIIAKHRNGDLDTVNTRFSGKHSKFSDLSDDVFAAWPKPFETATAWPSERPPEALPKIPDNSNSISSFENDKPPF